MILYSIIPLKAGTSEKQSCYFELLKLKE